MIDRFNSFLNALVVAAILSLVVIGLRENNVLGFLQDLNPTQTVVAFIGVVIVLFTTREVVLQCRRY